jgi:hypothetical protein
VDWAWELLQPVSCLFHLMVMFHLTPTISPRLLVRETKVKGLARETSKKKSFPALHLKTLMSLILLHAFLAAWWFGACETAAFAFAFYLWRFFLILLSS